MPNITFSSLLFIFHILYDNREITQHEHIFELSVFCLLMSYLSQTMFIHFETSIIQRFVTPLNCLLLQRSKHRKLWGEGRERTTISKPRVSIKIFLQICLKPLVQKTHEVTHSFIKINYTTPLSNKWLQHCQKSYSQLSKRSTLRDYSFSCCMSNNDFSIFNLFS